MSVYSRWVEARGTTSIVSMPALRHASKPVSCSRLGLGAWSGDWGCGAIEEPPLIQYGSTLKPYSDWTASAGTTGLALLVAMPLLPGPCSLSSATTVSTRESVPCTCETADAPSEWPMIAIRVVRPGVTERLSGERSHTFHSGLNALTGWSEPFGFLYGWSGVETKKSSASSVPMMKFDGCWNGTPGQPPCSSSAGGANGLQNGSALTWSFWCGSVSERPCPWTS